MSLPRPVFPGSVYMITRRCTQRRFLLKPSKRRNAAWLYCLAYAAKKSGVKVLWTSVMSNHHHTGVFDPEGNISVFCRELHRLIAKHHNAQYGRFENFWCSAPTGRLRLVGSRDVLDKLVYSITNPVKDHLVARAYSGPIRSPIPKASDHRFRKHPITHSGAPDQRFRSIRSLCRDRRSGVIVA